LRKEQVTWKVKCPICGKFKLKKEIHQLSDMCRDCHAKNNLPVEQCRAKTNAGDRCRNSARQQGYCKLHFAKRMGR